MTGATTLMVAMTAVLPAGAAPGPSSHGYTWTAVNVPGSLVTEPLQINNEGVVVGVYSDGNGPNGFIERSGQYTTVNDPIGPSYLNGINDFGEIAGTVYPGSYSDGFIDVGGRFTTIQDPSADNSVGSGYGTEVVGINDFGQVVGTYMDSVGTLHGFIYSNGHYFTLNCPGAGTGFNPNSDAGSNGTVMSYVSSLGAISGSCITGASTGNYYYNFIYSNGHYTTLPYVPGATLTELSWVNDLGVSGGWYENSGGIWNGYTYNQGQFTTIVDPAGAYGIYPVGANDVGAMVGYYLDSDGNINGFLMTPNAFGH